MKTYTTPIFKPIKLASNNNGTCKITSTNTDYMCPVTDVDSGSTIFSDSMVCDWVSENGKEYKICYHIPLGDNTVYNS